MDVGCLVKTTKQTRHVTLGDDLGIVVTLSGNGIPERVTLAMTYCLTFVSPLPATGRPTIAAPTSFSSARHPSE